MPYRVVIRDPELQAMLDDPRHRGWRKIGYTLHKPTKDTIKKLEQDPMGPAHSELLKYQYKGLRSAHVNKKWRLIYKVCEECIRCQFQNFNPLPCCCGDEPCDPQLVNVTELSEHYQP